MNAVKESTSAQNRRTYSTVGGTLEGSEKVTLQL